MRVGISRTKRAISGILAAVIMFTMLFTVGAGFFLFVNTNNNLYDQALSARNSAQQNQLSESLQLTSLALNNGNIAVYANNTGGIGVNITGLFISYSGKTVTQCSGVGLPSSSCTAVAKFPSCQLPAYVNTGKGIKGVPMKSGTGCTSTPDASSNQCKSSGALLTCLDTGQPANSTTAAIRVVTQRGNIFTTTYPPSAITLASQALSSGAIGDLYLSPSTFTFYAICTTSSGSCTSCLSGSSCYLQKQGYGFTMAQSFATSNALAFSVRVTDYSPQHLNITLDAVTVLTNFMIPSGSGSNSKQASWYIVSNSSNQIQSTYSKITLKYGIPATIVFASNSIGTFSGFVMLTNVFLSTPQIALVFLITHGCEGIKNSNCNSGTYNYGQNSPYVSTEYT